MSNNGPCIEHLDLLDTEYAALLAQGIDPRSYIRFLQAQKTDEAQNIPQQLDDESIPWHRSIETLYRILDSHCKYIDKLRAENLGFRDIATRIFLVSLVGSVALDFFSANKAVIGYTFFFGLGAVSVRVCSDIVRSRNR